MATERSYVATLNMMIDVFLKPLRKASARYDEYLDEFGKSFLVDPELEYTEEGDPKVVINPRSVKAIFLEVETLKAINSMFLLQLEAKVTDWGTFIAHLLSFPFTFPFTFLSSSVFSLICFSSRTLSLSLSVSNFVLSLHVIYFVERALAAHLLLVCTRARARVVSGDRRTMLSEVSPH